MTEELRPGCVSVVSHPGKIDDNLNKMEFFLARGVKKNVSLMIFPEMNITGYSSGAQLFETAVSLDTGLIKKLCSFSVKYKIPFLCGLAEKEDHNIYASHIFVKNGEIQGCYRKIQPGPPEIGYLTPGNDIPLFEHDGWKFGIQLCFDSHFPEISTVMTKKGADLIIIPHASPRGTSQEKYESWKRHLLARAFDNSLYIIALNQCGKNSNGLFFPGISMAVDPSGKVEDKFFCEKESLHVFNLSKDKIDDVRNHRMKHFFKYRRDSFYKSVI